MDTRLEPRPEGGHRLLAVVAHPDDPARDAANRWIFPELLDEGLEPWSGVTHVSVMGSNHPTHAVDVTSTLDAGIESLETHRAYVDGTGRDFDPAEFLRAMTIEPGRPLGVKHAVAFGRVQLAGV